MESDHVAGALEDGGLQIVVEQLARRATEGLEGERVAADEALQCLIEDETREDCPRVREHHHEARERPLRPLDLDRAEMSPVDLSLLAGQRREPEEGLP